MIEVESVTFALKIFVAWKIKKDVDKTQTVSKMKKNCRKATSPNHCSKKVKVGLLWKNVVNREI